MDIALRMHYHRAGAPPEYADRQCEDLLHYQLHGWPDAAKALEFAAELTALEVNGRLSRQSWCEVLGGYMDSRGTPLSASEIEAIVAASGEPDPPRRAIVPLPLALHAPTDGWRKSAILGSDDPVEARRVLASLAGYLLHHQVDPYIVAALLVSWAWAMCETPVYPSEALGIVDNISRRDAAVRGVA